MGVDMLVMDDGWFGHRNLDNSSLGDWFVNEKKIKGGLSKLIERVNAEGLKFGIWYEPEMISPDSELYRAHRLVPARQGPRKLAGTPAVRARHVARGRARQHFRADVQRPEKQQD